MFNAIQNALFVMMFDDDDDIPQDKAVRTANGMMDSILRIRNRRCSGINS